MTEGTRRLAAIMFTDLQGYTALTQQNEGVAMRMLDAYRALSRPIFAKHGGREVKTMGDGALVEFGSALEAVECAIELQRAVHERNAASQAKLTLRVGIHVGDVIHKENDVLGDAVNIASRIEPLASGGGVCFTGQVYYQVRNKLPYEAKLLDNQGLKNVSIPTDVYRLNMSWDSEPAAGTAAREQRLAVLPLDNISPDPNDAYFADGLHDELITALSKVNGLEVIARTSVLRYRGGTKQIAAIGKELGVGSVLEGSVRKAGNRIRVTAQLIRSSNEAHMWAETYDRQLDDVFAVQSDIAGKVAEALKVRLSDSEKSSARPVENMEAYTLYLRGRMASTRVSTEHQLRAIEFFEKALRISPDFAACYAALSVSYSLLGFFELDKTNQAREKAREYAQKAINLDDTVAEGHLAMARVHRSFDWDIGKSQKEVSRALELAPSFAFARGLKAQNLISLGRLEEGEREARKALELDPLSPTNLAFIGTLFLYENHTEEAIELYNRSLELEPDSSFPMNNLGLAYVRMGETEKGIELMEKARRMAVSPSAGSDLAYAYSKAGRKEDVQRILTFLLDEYARTRMGASAVAGVYAIMGDSDKAFEWLDIAVKERTPYLASVHEDFIFDSLHSDPRYAALEKKIGIVGSG